MEGKVIGLDARMVGPVPTGLGRYAVNLVRTLVRLDPHNRYVVIRQPSAPGPIAEGPNVEEVLLPGDLDGPRNLLAGPAISRLGLDLYHSLHHFLPPMVRAGRLVVTLHDLIWVEHADLTFDTRLAWLRRRLVRCFAGLTIPHALRRADRIVAISHHTARRALHRYRLDPERVHVVYHGVEEHFFADPCDGEGRPPHQGQGEGVVVGAGDPEAVGGAASGSCQGGGRARWDGPPREGRYFFCLGNTKPYKNVRGAIHAFARVAGEEPDVHLVITGRSDSFRALRDLASRLGVAGRVSFTGPLHEAEVLRLFRGAVALVFPSLVEGFGFPVVEAMALGCPVVGSAAPTVAEVAGDAALLPEPEDPDDIAHAMLRVLREEGLAASLREKGRARARAFTWEACARRTLEVYRLALRGPGCGDGWGGREEPHQGRK